jgi:hypothetical protein
MFLEIVETSYHAYYASGNEKLLKVHFLITKLDSVKFLLTIAWENRLIQNKQYEELAHEMTEIGQMLFGWKRSIEKTLEKTKTPIQ